MTKQDIVTRLLEEKKISVEEAVVLLIDSGRTEYVYVPWTQPYMPQYPWVTYTTSDSIKPPLI